MEFREKAYDIFEMFDKSFALVTAGSPDKFNSCTISWGSFGNIWGAPGKSKATITVYVHPTRYTNKFLEENDKFTVSFFPEEHKKALMYMGVHSGKDGNKAEAAGLIPVVVEDTVSFEEAELIFICRKLYQHQFIKEDLPDDVKEYYSANSKVFTDESGEWQPHIVYIGEVLDVIDKK